MGFRLASRVRGLSDAAFREAFGQEEQCRATLFRLRWPEGFVCPACGHLGTAFRLRSTMRYLHLANDKTSATPSPLDLLEFPRPVQS